MSDLIKSHHSPASISPHKSQTLVASSIFDPSSPFLRGDQPRWPEAGRLRRDISIGVDPAQARIGEKTGTVRLVEDKKGQWFVITPWRDGKEQAYYKGLSQPSRDQIRREIKSGQYSYTYPFKANIDWSKGLFDTVPRPNIQSPRTALTEINERQSRQAAFGTVSPRASAPQPRRQENYLQSVRNFDPYAAKPSNGSYSWDPKRVYSPSTGVSKKMGASTASNSQETSRTKTVSLHSQNLSALRKTLEETQFQSGPNVLSNETLSQLPRLLNGALKADREKAEQVLDNYGQALDWYAHRRDGVSAQDLGKLHQASEKAVNALVARDSRAVSQAAETGAGIMETIRKTSIVSVAVITAGKGSQALPGVIRTGNAAFKATTYAGTTTIAQAVSSSSNRVPFNPESQVRNDRLDIGTTMLAGGIASRIPGLNQTPKTLRQATVSNLGNGAVDGTLDATSRYIQARSDGKPNDVALREAVEQGATSFAVSTLSNGIVSAHSLAQGLERKRQKPASDPESLEVETRRAPSQVQTERVAVPERQGTSVHTVPKPANVSHAAVSPQTTLAPSTTQRIPQKDVASPSPATAARTVESFTATQEARAKLEKLYAVDPIKTNADKRTQIPALRQVVDAKMRDLELKGLTPDDIVALRMSNLRSQTGLPNGNALPLIQKKGEYIVRVSLGNFKSINDSFDHHKGDLVIQAVANKMQGTLARELKDPNHGRLVHLGGDNFAFVASSQEEGQKLLQKVQSDLRYDTKIIFQKPETKQTYVMGGFIASGGIGKNTEEAFQALSQSKQALVAMGEMPPRVVTRTNDKTGAIETVAPPGYYTRIYDAQHQIPEIETRNALTEASIEAEIKSMRSRPPGAQRDPAMARVRGFINEMQSHASSLSPNERSSLAKALTFANYFAREPVAIKGLEGTYGLLNKEAYDELKKAYSAKMDIDVDSLGKVNAILGQEAGDEMLAQVGRRLSRLAERTPGMVGVHLSGDEYALFHQDPKVIQRAMEELNQELKQVIISRKNIPDPRVKPGEAPRFIDGRLEGIGVSFGPNEPELLRHKKMREENGERPSGGPDTLPPNMSIVEVKP